MKKLTEEHKNKISESHKKRTDIDTGNYFYCLICGKQFWRKPYDIKKGDNKFCSRECYFIWQRGRPRSEEFKEKCRNKKPWQNGNWKGGITPENKKIRASKEFSEWRKSVFERDNWTCQKCGARSKKNNYVRIEAHHIKPFATHVDLRFDVSNGLTLCKKCHSKEPKGREICQNTN